MAASADAGEPQEDSRAAPSPTSGADGASGGGSQGGAEADSEAAPLLGGRSPADAAALEAEAATRRYGPLVLLTVTGGQLLTQSRPRLVLEACGGDQRRAATLLAAYAGLGGTAEFLLNPLIGRLSDSFGRTPVICLAPALCGVLRGLVYMRPGSLRLIQAERALSVAIISGFFTTIRASLSDRLSGPRLAVATGAVGTWAGAGLIIGPFIESQVIRRLGPRQNFLLVTIVNLAVALGMRGLFRETLVPSERKPIDLGAANPLSFLELFGVSGTVRALMVTLLLQAFGEGKTTQDINQLYLRQHLKWTTAQIGYYASLTGVAAVLGGRTLGASLAALGQRGHTTLSNLAMALAYACQGLGKPPAFRAMAGFLLFSFIGGRRNAAVEALVTDHAAASSSLGKGQVAAALTNFKALAAILGPPIWARAYNWGGPRGVQGAPYLLIALLYLAAEAIFRSVPQRRLLAPGP